MASRGPPCDSTALVLHSTFVAFGNKETPDFLTEDDIKNVK